MVYERNFKLLNKNFNKLFFPTLMASIAGNFAVIIDAFFISLFMGPMFLSVVQSVEPLLAFVNVIYWLIGLGGSIVCTSTKAVFDDKKANEIFTVSMIVTLGLVLCLMLLCYAFPQFFMDLLCDSSQIEPLVLQYFYILIPGMLFLSYKVALAYFVKTDGFIKLQFYAFLISNLTNIVLDVVLMNYFNMGISGAAFATTLGALVSSIFITQYFFSSKRTLKFVKVKLSKVKGYLVDISKSGFSIASIPLYISIKLLFLNSLVTVLLGDLGLSALNMCQNTLFIVEIFILGTAQSLLPIIAVYDKEEDYNGVKYVVNRSLKIVLAFGIFFTLLFVLFPQIVLFIFSVNDPEHIPTVLHVIRIFSLCTLGFSINYMYLFYAQSVEFNKLANIIILLEGLILPVGLAYILTYFFGADGFWFSFLASELLTLLFIFAYSRYMERKSKGKYSGFFLDKHNEDKRVFEFTIEGNEEDAINLSHEVKGFLSDSELADNVSLALEEIVLYILDINEKVDLIDIIIREKNDCMIISIKNSGISYDPNKVDILKSENIRILREISDDIEYSQILGLNNTVITINN